jgi:predicted acetyltransferase
MFPGYTPTVFPVVDTEVVFSMSSQDSLTLEIPALAWKTEYLALVDESLAVDGQYPYNNVPLAQSDFAAFVQELDDEAKGINIPPGIPPQQTYFLVLDGTTVIGELRFRPHVEPPYEKRNGHIGYNLRPRYRGQGYGTRALSLLLDEARRRGLPGVQVPIEGDNPASVRIVEKNGGYLERQVTDPKTGAVISCYWIDLTNDD